MSAVLTAEETRRLTGYVKPSKQIEWLKRNGFTKGVDFFVNAAGYPIVWTVKQNTVSEPAMGLVP